MRKGVVPRWRGGCRGGAAVAWSRKIPAPSRTISGGNACLTRSLGRKMQGRGCLRTELHAGSMSFCGATPAPINTHGGISQSILLILQWGPPIETVLLILQGGTSVQSDSSVVSSVDLIPVPTVLVSVLPRGRYSRKSRRKLAASLDKRTGWLRGAPTQKTASLVKELDKS